MTARPRVLFCAHGGERTGPPVLLLRFARWLDALDVVDQEFVLLDPGPLVADFEEIGPTVVLNEFHPPVGVQAVESVLHRLPVPGAADWYRRRHLRRRLRRVARPDLVYVNTAGSVRALRYLDRGAAPVVTQIHELSVGLAFWLRPADLDLILEVSDVLLVVSDAVTEEMVRRGADRARISVQRGYVTPSEPGEEAVAGCREAIGVGPDALVVGACGTVDWRKAPDLFVRLATMVVERAGGREVHFVWLGGDATSPLAGALAADVARSPLADRIHVVSEVEDPMPWFGAMDVLTLPAREDAFPLVCLEAASLAVPVVCFDNGGMPEFVERAGAGRVAPYPDLGAFADAVADLLVDDDLRRATGARAARGIEEAHTVEVAAPGLWAEIEAHLPAGRGGGS